MTVRPGQAERGNEPGTAILCRGHVAIHPRHGGGEILARPRPARRVHPGRAAQCRDTEPGIIGQCRQAARPRRRQRLDARIADEIGRVLHRFRQAQRTGRYHRDAMRAAAARSVRRACRGCGLPGQVEHCDQSGAPSRLADRPALRLEQRRNTLARKAQHPEKLRLAERAALGGALDLDDAAAVGQHEVGVRVGR